MVGEHVTRLSRFSACELRFRISTAIRVNGTRCGSECFNDYAFRAGVDPAMQLCDGEAVSRRGFTHLDVQLRILHRASAPRAVGLCRSNHPAGGCRQRAVKREDFQLTDFLHGVRFDLNGDGIEEQVAWTAGGSHLAFLAMDRNTNGKIDNGKELFTNFTNMAEHSGFEALKWENNGVPERLKEMSAGWGNPVFDKLLLWEDDNHDGISQPEEIHKFSDHYLAIDALCVFDPLTDKWGNESRYRGAAAVKEPGMTRTGAWGP